MKESPPSIREIFKIPLPKALATKIVRDLIIGNNNDLKGLLTVTQLLLGLDLIRPFDLRGPNCSRCTSKKQPRRNSLSIDVRHI